MQNLSTNNGYAWGGKSVDPDSPESLAKFVKDEFTGNVSYWLKRASVGIEAGKLYNPQSPTFGGKSKYVYRKANKESFDAFVKFLSPPNNVSYLRVAERMP
jgi:hypothetical protein